MTEGSRLYLGIDPGVNGGIAAVTSDGFPVWFVKMPETDRDVYERLRDLDPIWRTAMIEKAQASPQMGVVSAFTYGRGYGALRMALAASDIPYEEVSSRRWMGALGCLTGGDKNISKAKAQAMFPIIKVTHAIADALLIAEYCRRVHLSRR